METVGELAPATPTAARERYDGLGSTAQVVVTEVAKAMEMDADEYDERVTSDVIETARDSLFASQLEVHVGTREEYVDWLDDHAEYDVRELGSEHVENVAWHAAHAAETVVAATFHEERDAAVGTLRRQAFGRVYRDLVTAGVANDDTDAEDRDADADTDAEDSDADDDTDADDIDADADNAGTPTE